MAQLTIRLFGGIDVRRDDRQITTFESHKVRALLAYLLAQRERSYSRQQLAALLWPDKSAEAARRNLRQAVYNLKQVLSGARAAASPILSSGSELRIDPELDCWVDIEAFEHARRQGISKGAIDPHYLTASVALYRGDFLSGFALRDNLEFEFWQLSEQERLRDLAVDALRALIENYLSRGEFRLGLQYARRLVAIEPLSEEAHRYLMRLYALLDQRSRSLAQYDELRDTLLHELGVEPVEETQKLYEKILTEQAPAPPKEIEQKGIGPVIPMVGRQEPYRRIGKCWSKVLEGRCRWTLVAGEPGAGKNRLIKSFLDAASSRRAVTILKGHCDDLVPTAYQPFAQVLRSALTDDSRQARKMLEAVSGDQLPDLALLIPELRDLEPGSSPATLDILEDRERLFGGIARILEALCRPAEIGSATEPLVLMLGDLQWAGGETFDLLEYLLERLENVPIWFLCTQQTDPTSAQSHSHETPVDRLRAAAHAPQSHIVLERLQPAAIEELAATLVGNDQACELARFLIAQTQGLPLAIAECINSMWDQNILIQQEGHWRLQGSLAGGSGDLDELIRSRLHRLPTSTRRLASQAAIMGQQFDAELLCRAANEHMSVVEIGLELMLERWLIRQHSDYWMTGRREHDIVLWAQGARRGRFEFNHHLIRRSILEDVNPLRRQIMHREVAEALEGELAEQAGKFCEVLAFHFARADAWDRAIVHLRQAARRAHALLAADTARHYYRQTATALDRLSGAERTPEGAQRWLEEREQITAALEELKVAPGDERGS